MQELYIFTDKNLTGFYTGYLTGLKKASNHSRFLGIFKRKSLDFDFKVNISEWADYKKQILYTEVWAINNFTKAPYKGKNITLDKILDKTFLSKEKDCDNKYGKKDMIVIKSKNKKLLAKLKSYFERRKAWCPYSFLIIL